MTEDKEFEQSKDELETKSKTQRKREVESLQALGVEISMLPADQRAKIPLPTNLKNAIDDAQRIKTNSAKRRHMQYIGKLMRSADIDAIKAAYGQLIESSHRATRQFHTIEKWRDTLISDDDSFARFLENYPEANRQQLHQMVRLARKDSEQGKPEGTRKLFRFIRDTISP